MLVLELVSAGAKEHELLIQLFLADAVKVEQVEILEDARL